MSSIYVSLANVPVNPPNTTALWWSILVNVWELSGGGFSPVVSWTTHTSAGKVTQQKMYKSEHTSAPCLHKDILPLRSWGHVELFYTIDASCCSQTILPVRVYHCQCWSFSRQNTGVLLSVCVALLCDQQHVTNNTISTLGRCDNYSS